MQTQKAYALKRVAERRSTTVVLAWARRGFLNLGAFLGAYAAYVLLLCCDHGNVHTGNGYGKLAAGWVAPGAECVNSSAAGA
jgi:hypothetical protein